MKRIEAMQKCIDYINSLKGADEIKEKMNNLHLFLKDKEPYVLLNSIADFFIVAQRGGGIKTTVRFVAEYLYVANAIEFCGKEKWFSYQLNYIEPGNYFNEIDMFKQKMSVIKGFNRYFKGVIYINLDKWIGHTEEEHFKSFMKYLSTIDDRVFFVFGVHSENQENIDNLYSALSQYIRIDMINQRFPNVFELSVLVIDYIKNKGFSFSNNTFPLIQEMIQVVISKKYFKGFDTIEKFSEDIIFHFFMTNNDRSKEITLDVLESYQKKSLYLKQMSDEQERKITIGF